MVDIKPGIQLVSIPMCAILMFLHCFLQYCFFLKKNSSFKHHQMALSNDLHSPFCQMGGMVQWAEVSRPLRFNWME
jgi:hypothetical protein